MFEQNFKHRRLLDSLSTLKEELGHGLKEYHLLQILSSEPFYLFDQDCLKDTLLMFQAHFILFNSLYHLRDQWLSDQTGVLDIHTTRIHLLPYSEGQSVLLENDPLRTYYLNWENMHGVEQADVDDLIDSFWRRMPGQLSPTDENTRKEACLLLDLPPDAPVSAAELKNQYRKKMLLYHPDKGGNVEKAKQIGWAYEVLSRFC